MQKILLLTGGSGYLGRHLARRAVSRFSLVTAYHRSPAVTAGRPLPLDLTDREAVFRAVEALQPQAIIHAAAINPGSGDEAAMMRVNADGTRHLAEAARQVGARLVHVSTDVVHDGRHAPYPDDAPPAPLNAYGRSKAAGEAAVAGACPQAVIVRTSLIYGLEEMDRGTAGFVQKLRSGRPLILFHDVIRQPVWVETLCEALLRLVDLPVAGILNVAGRQPLTREAFARRMLAFWQVDRLDLLRSGRAADVSAEIPLDLRLEVSRAENLLGMTFPGVDEVLARHQASMSA